MKISPSYNPEESKFSIEITTNLLKDYFLNFRGMVLDCETVPKDVEVVKKGSETALVTFSMKKEELESVGKSIPSGILSEVGKMLGIPSDSIGGRMFNAEEVKPFEEVNQVLQKFVEKASIYKFSKTEFIPLTNYSEEELKNDCIAALKANRDFCIVDDFNKYRKAMDDRTYVLNYTTVPYATEEYVNIALLIITGNLDKVREMYTPVLKQDEWLKI